MLNAGLRKIILLFLLLFSFCFFGGADCGYFNYAYDDNKETASKTLDELSIQKHIGGIDLARLSSRVRTSLTRSLILVFVILTSISTCLIRLSSVNRLRFCKLNNLFRLFDRYTKLFSRGLLQPKLYQN